MIIYDLFEGLRTPLIEKLEAYADDPDVYLTFTNVLKVGVNPSSDWNDPIGIYAYPVREMIEDFQSQIVPFAGDRKYGLILRSVGYVEDLQQYTQERLDSDLERIQKKYWNVLTKVTTGPEYWEHLLIQWYERWGGNPGLGLWKITERISKFIAMRMPERDERMIWNSIFRSLGNGGLVDRGGAIISSNEPTQAVFFSASAVKLLSSNVNDLFGKARP